MIRPSRTCALVRVPKPLTFIIICLLLKTFWQSCSQVHVGFRCLYHCLLNSKKIHSWWVLMKLFLIFFPSLALVHKPCRLMVFLLILKELSHGGKNLSYVTMLICFWFLNYVDTFTLCPMHDCVFFKKLNSASLF